MSSSQPHWSNQTYDTGIASGDSNLPIYPRLMLLLLLLFTVSFILIAWGAHSFTARRRRCDTLQFITVETIVTHPRHPPCFFFFLFCFYFFFGGGLFYLINYCFALVCFYWPVQLKMPSSITVEPLVAINWSWIVYHLLLLLLTCYSSLSVRYSLVIIQFFGWSLNFFFLINYRWIIGCLQLALDCLPSLTTVINMLELFIGSLLAGYHPIFRMDQLPLNHWLPWTGTWLFTISCYCY